ncbi:MAG: type II toxin-antitoxin system RelB/DinJ family antitoxin [bacterium]
MSAIQVRIDEKTKKSANKVLSEIGLDMSSAIKLYLKQIVLQKGIPFPLVTENGFTIQEESEIIKAAEQVRDGRNISKSMSPKQALKHLDLL